MSRVYRQQPQWRNHSNLHLIKTRNFQDCLLQMSRASPSAPRDVPACPPARTQSTPISCTSDSHGRSKSTRSSSRTQSLNPTFSSQQRLLQTQPLNPIPESKYNPQDEEPMVFRPISPDRRAGIECWKWDIVAGAPAPPSSVRGGGREDDYDGLESVGWWESSSQPVEGMAGSEGTRGREGA